MGNLRSVQKAVEHLGFTCVVRQKIEGASKLILPGVGAFGAAMERLSPLAAEIRSYASAGGPLLGICLGQQLLFETSEELGAHAGLSIIPGHVRYLPRDLGLKVPHMGWSALTPLAGKEIAQNIGPGEQVYFVHSLYTDCTESSDIAATATYGLDFPAAVQRGNIWGAQFHPEKSGCVGLRVLENFLEC